MITGIEHIALGVAAPGRRPGTKVFTVKSHTTGLPMLVIGGEGIAQS